MTPLTPFVTRFAPSPTGHLHLGHIVNAIYVWGIAGRRGGTVLLRVEDHDRQRSRPEFERSILDDLEWLGFSPAGSPTRQSERVGYYQAHLERLRGEGLAYVCSCSRREMSLTAPDVPGEEMRYPGTCRDRNLGWRPGLSWRIRLGDEPVEFPDRRLGLQRQTPAHQCGDLQAMDRLGNWSYQFAVTVDDYLQEVNLVIRGEDLLPSTGRQIMLAGMLGRSTPAEFLHHPLILKPGGQKLSKAARDSGVRELRAQGATPARVIGLAAHAVGLIPEEKELHPSELPDLF